MSLTILHTLYKLYMDIQYFVASPIYNPNYFAFEYGGLSLISAGVSDTSALVCMGTRSVFTVLLNSTTTSKPH